MAITDVFKINQMKATIDQLQNELLSVRNELTSAKATMEEPDMKTAISLQKTIERRAAEVRSLVSETDKLNRKIRSKQKDLNELQEQLVSVSDQVEMESFGIYKPRYNFATSLEYKNRLAAIRQDQKQMITKDDAVNYNRNWLINGSATKGKKMIRDTIKLALRCFNNECEAAINKVTYSNFDSTQKRIIRSYEQINKLNAMNEVEIKSEYLELKLNELALAFEYELKVQEEKEKLKEEREREREEKKLQAEINQKKKIIEKDITHYGNMILELDVKIKKSEDADEIAKLKEEIEKLRTAMQEKEEEKEDLDYRIAHASAGYVYIISNIGSFGEDVVKIGVTRRLNPYERISELSSASVPFRFDIHALIFSYDAYTLESELHQQLEKQRLNAVNYRKEFFKVSIDEIYKILQEYKNLTIDFTQYPEAAEYRETLKLKELNTAN